MKVSIFDIDDVKPTSNVTEKLGCVLEVAMTVISEISNQAIVDSCKATLASWVFERSTLVGNSFFLLRNRPF